jgi:hypothetical protein
LGILQWLKIGIALFLIISKPQVEIDKDFVKTKFEISNLLTDEMTGLIKNGMEFDYEAYISLITVDTSNKKNLFRKKIRRKIKYDYLSSSYYLMENNVLLIKYNKFEEMLSDAKRYQEVSFKLNTSNYVSYSFYVEIYPIENPIIEETLKMKTSDLWNGYKPSVKFNCDSRGMEIK